ncbi:Vwa8 [Symbiodinium pilosum]|uniref:Vwa8 protein n=1 Tax=Symbiodinium pilosum TaxID=2952 RepID=A0A812W8V7_SYMPI|nr:Vwa8 [Symbiodinium pilosum]
MDASAASSSRHDSKTLRGTFQLMTWTFSLNHATMTTLMMYASSALGRVNGNLSNALLFSVSLATSLGLAPVIVNTFGQKRGLLLGLVGCTTYVLFFVLAVFLSTWRHRGIGGCQSNSEAMLAFVGAGFGGLGAGLLWPSQGAFFSTVVQELQRAEPATGTREEALYHLTSELSSSFAFGLLAAECGIKLMMAVLLTYVKVELWSSWVFLSALVLAVLAMAAFTKSQKIHSQHAVRPVCESTWDALRLWGDPKIWLLSMTNLSFGFSVAWVNGYVNLRWHEATGDLHLLGFAGALTTGVAGVVSKLSVRPLACGKGVMLALGSFCFLSIGLVSKLSEPNSKLGWSIWLLLLHVLHGVGRGVYEGTGKAVFGDFFPGDKCVGAFANVLVQVSASSIIGYILASTGWKDATYSLLVVSAALMLPFYLLAGRLECLRSGFDDSGKDLERAPSDR